MAGHDLAEQVRPAASWSGSWVAERLDVDVTTTEAPVGLELADLVGLAVRRNPRRAHLLVSHVLGKHVPADPRLVLGAGHLLGELVRHRLEVPGGPTSIGSDLLAVGGLLRAGLAGDLPATAALAAAMPTRGPLDTAGGVPSAVVLGFAETATGLGHCVADRLGHAPYLHSTRRQVDGIPATAGFEEQHSHATSHLLLPADPELLRSSAPLVLVDDELSTGATALNTIAALQQIAPRDRYVLATLVDVRSDEDRATFQAAAAAWGTRIDVVALASGRVGLPTDVLTRGQALVERLGGAAAGDTPRAPADPSDGDFTPVDLGWPGDLAETARHGYIAEDRHQLEAHLPALSAQLAAAVSARRPAARRVLVLGTEELMYAPLRLAVGLAELLDATGTAGAHVRFSTTTRSPVLAVDDPGYAIRTRLEFPAPEGEGVRFAYNLGIGVSLAAAEEPFDTIVVVTDEAADTPRLSGPGGLVEQLAAAGTVLLTVLPGSAAQRVRDAASKEAR